MLPKLVLLALLALPLSALAQAPAPNQPSPRAMARLHQLPPAERATLMTQRLEQEASPFTDEQRARIQAINLRTAQEVEAHREQLRQQHQAVRKAQLDREGEISALLTPEQRDRLNTARAARQTQVRARHRQWQRQNAGFRRMPHHGQQPQAPADTSRH